MLFKTIQNAGEVCVKKPRASGVGARKKAAKNSKEQVAPSNQREENDDNEKSMEVKNTRSSNVESEYWLNLKKRTVPMVASEG